MAYYKSWLIRMFDYYTEFRCRDPALKHDAELLYGEAVSCLWELFDDILSSEFLNDSAYFFYTYIPLGWIFELARILFSYRIAFTGWPGGRYRALSTTWPWNVKTSLMVLWGVCWMFYGSPRPNNSLDLHLIDQFNEPSTANGDYNLYPEEFLDGYTGSYSEQKYNIPNIWLI